jgi:hypothetical protein
MEGWWPWECCYFWYKMNKFDNRLGRLIQKWEQSWMYQKWEENNINIDGKIERYGKGFLERLVIGGEIVGICLYGYFVEKDAEIRGRYD